MKYLVLIVIGALLTCPAAADIINGSFETGDFTGWNDQTSGSYAEVVPGGTDGAWHAQVHLFGEYVDLPQGTVFGRGFYALWQEFLVPDDAKYLAFDAWVEGSLYIQVHAHLRGEENYDLIVTASEPTSFIIDVSDVAGDVGPLDFLFYDTDEGTNIGHLDNVHVVVIPEPSCVLLIASGLIGLSVLRRVG